MDCRVFAEKKEQYNTEALGLLEYCKTALNIEALNSVRVVNIYDVFEIGEATLDIALKTVFSEPPLDTLYLGGELSLSGLTYFAVEPRPGQYDQRGDSAEQCVRLIDPGALTKIKSGKLYILGGNLSGSEIEYIKKQVINPLESREKDLSRLTASESFKAPSEIPVLEGFTALPKKALGELKSDMALAMGTADVAFVQKYFRDVEKRNPTETELRVLDTYWSDHCRHTTFETELTEITLPKNPRYSRLFESTLKRYLESRRAAYGDAAEIRPVTLMDLATVSAKEMRKKGLLNDLEVSGEVNACSIYVDADNGGKTEKWILQFKNETHNHPTEIEPFGGASTCIGGAIRDPLSGRAYVYQSMRVSGSADPTAPVESTLKGKLPQRALTVKAAHGFSSYGNQIGLAATHISEIYHPGYAAKRLEAGFVIGAVRAENVRREEPSPGDKVILLGGRTGRDGIGGATGSSKEHDSSSGEKSATEVQKGNAPEERKIQRLFRKPEVTKLIKKCNDFGAGGVSVAIGELADGILIDLNAVSVKYDGLSGTELAISESQERMAVLVAPEDAAAFIEYAGKENLEAAAVAEITGDNRLRMRWNGSDIVNLRRDFLSTNGVRTRTEVLVIDPPEDLFSREDLNGSTVRERFLNNLKNLNVASQKGLVERFDNTIGASTVLMPFGGRTMTAPTDVSAEKLPIERGRTGTVSAAAYGFNPYLTARSPFHGALYAVVESVAKLVAAGAGYKGIRFTFQEYFEKLGRDKIKWGKPFAALLGAYYAVQELGLPATGGKDSMSGTFEDINVPPTLISFAVNTCKTDSIISPEFKRAGDRLYLFKAERRADGTPDFKSLEANFDKIGELIRSGVVTAAGALRYGGVMETLAKMSFGNEIGFEAEIADEILTSFEYGAVLVASSKEIAFPNAVYIGKTVIDGIRLNGESIDMAEALEAWTSPLDGVFPSKRDMGGSVMRVDYDTSDRLSPRYKALKPKVVIPAFYGTNCEYDSEYAFMDAGAEVSVPVFRTLSPAAIEDSILRLAEELKTAHILMLPGGFSAGDEPDGSAKYIANVLRNRRVLDAVKELIGRDGLILGICNGFQALLKSGLLPFGGIEEQTRESATLTYNVIGRHIAKIVPVRIASNKSPWFYGFKPGDLHYVPMSHGEGRLVASAETVSEWIENGQVAAQYADLDGNPTMKSQYNPNGSVRAIEAISSIDGRILGKMGHNERTGAGLYRNIAGDKNRDIFRNGVKYFE